MCGICGKYNFEQNKPVERQLIADMASRLYRRGPDDKGFLVRGNCGLGVRRLSIIDKKNGQQPVRNEDNTIFCVHNGEIYNFQSLKQDLLKKGHFFYSACDSEIIPHLYEEYGDNFICKLNGMFAIAILDTNKNSLLIGRDRIGIKPLYYGLVEGGVVFASSLFSLMIDRTLSRDLDPTGMDHYFTENHFQAQFTPFSQVKKLLPGHYMLCQDAGMKINKYWELEYCEQTQKSEKYFQDEFSSLFRSAVKGQFNADVPIGVFISGGIDSGGLANYAAKFNPEIKTFSIGFNEKTFDERGYAQMVARKFGLKNHCTIVPDNIVKVLEKNIDAFDLPDGEGSFLPTLILSEFAKQYVGVILSGEGADELFGGYQTYKADIFAYYCRVLPKFIRHRLLPFMAKELPLEYNWMNLRFKTELFLKGIQDTNKISHYYWRQVWNDFDKENFYSQIWKERLYQNYKHPYQSFLKLFASSDLRHFIDRAMFYDTKILLPDCMLQRIDMASMYHALEVRVPFLDNKIIEFALGLPQNMKIRNLTGKYLLRKTFRDILPAEILKRPKHGLSVPVSKWLSHDLKEFAYDIFSSTNCDIIDKKYILKLFKEHINQKNDYGRKLWNVLIFLLWYNNFKNKW